MSVLKEIMTDFRALDQNRSAMRKFGLLCGLILLVIAGFILFRKGLPETALYSAPVLLIAAGGTAIVLALVHPMLLRPLNSVLVIVSLIIGFCLTRIILVLVFFFMFFPTGILLKLMGKDPLRLKPEPAISSYWIHRPDEPFDPSRCRRLF